MEQQLRCGWLIAYMSSLQYLLAVVILVAVGLSIVGCLPVEQAPLRIGVSPWPGHAFAYLAQELGYFEEEGCNVRLLSFTSLADAQRAYFRKQLHGIYATNVELLQACALPGRHPCAIHVTDLSHGGDMILAAPSIQSINDLRGQNVGCEPGSVSMFVLAHALAQHGMTLDDVNVVLCDQHEQRRQFVEGELAAVVTYPPTSHTLLNEDGARRLYCTRNMPGLVANLLFVEAGIAQTRDPELARLIRAFDRAVAYAAQNPDQAARLMAPHLMMTPERVRHFLKHEMQIVSLAEQQAYLEQGHLADALARSVNTLKRSGLFAGEIDITACLRPRPAMLAAALGLQRQPYHLADKQAAPTGKAGTFADAPMTPSLP